jgi:hypothetical protein|tara:strand:- start:1293 stop:2033 length:741 start_codon:yes stop_codon:yes gene_type:complete
VADAEIAANAEAFRVDLPKSLATNIAAHKAAELAKIDTSYARLTVLQAFRSHVLHDIPVGAMGFFTEAQSDGLSSNVLITAGMGRSALKSLRSLIENIVRAVYYADHQIEYRLWETKNHRPSFKSLFDYLQTHPDIRNLPSTFSPANNLYRSWKDLSNAVHASLIDLRTSTNVEEIKLWRTDQATVAKWSKKQQEILENISLLYLGIHRERLQGAKVKPLRQALSHTIRSKFDAEINSSLGIKIAR